MSKPTKRKRQQRTFEAASQAAQLQRVLATLARGIHKTRDTDLIEAWDSLMSFWRGSLEKTVAFEDGEQRKRQAAADSQRRFTHEQFEREEPKAKNDKDLARNLKVHPGTIARYRAKRKRSPSLTEQMIEEARAERARTTDDMRRALGRAQCDLDDARAEIELAKATNAQLHAQFEKLRRRKKT